MKKFLIIISFLLSFYIKGNSQSAQVTEWIGTIDVSEVTGSDTILQYRDVTKNFLGYQWSCTCNGSSLDVLDSVTVEFGGSLFQQTANNYYFSSFFSVFPYTFTTDSIPSFYGSNFPAEVPMFKLTKKDATSGIFWFRCLLYVMPIRIYY